NDAGRAGRRAEQHRRGEHRKALDEREQERDRQTRHEQRQEDMAEALPGTGAMRCCGLLERRIDAGDVAERQQKGEREAGDQQRREDAPVVMREAGRGGDQVQQHQGLGEPALRPEIIEQALRYEDRAQRDRQHENGGQQPLPAQQPHPHGDRNGDQQADDGDRNGQRQRGPDGVVLERVGEERRIVGEPAARLRREAEPQAVEERIDEDREQEQERRQDQQRGAIEAAQRQAAAQGNAGCLGAHAPPAKTSARAASTASVTPAPGSRRCVVWNTSSLPSAPRPIPTNSRPRYSTLSILAPSPPLPSVTSSGRATRVALSPAFRPAVARPATVASPTLTVARPASTAATVPRTWLRKPMNSATSRLAGLS